MKSLTRNNIRLRALEPSDVDLLYEWENDPEIWPVGNIQLPYSRHTIEQFIHSARTDIYESRQARWMIDLIPEEQKDTIGTIDLFDFDPHHRRIGIGILIKNEAHRQKGYASDALSLILEYCFTILDLNQVYCTIPETNTPSILLFKKHHFTITGAKKEWLVDGDSRITELFLQLLKSEYRSHL